ncbi:hypothetical protein [Nonomuraea sp. NPDC003709]|uniref:hypothetical protein n=1 Tax=Nonomuraea sp. NPDC003709 TaxID=3154450 RepID=UPI0033A93C5D
MRISASQLRDAATNPKYRLPKKSGGGPSTDSALRKVLRIVHENGPQAAIDALSQALAADYWQDKGKPMALTAHECLRSYIDLAEDDERIWAPGNRQEVTIDGDVVAAGIDGLLVCDDGYWGRMVIPGPLPAPLTDAQRAILACPATLALINELEGGLFDERPVLGVEVWELRRGIAGKVDRAAAEAALPNVQRILDRLRE